MQDLFHSVQLNVNNPHFLIMQGKITKVLNAKPPEILGMLEEAAGTRMYESKKEAALRTLARKQVKVDEIDRLLEDEVEPALERLRRERGEYVAWQEALDRLDALRRFCAAFSLAPRAWPTSRRDLFSKYRSNTAVRSVSSSACIASSNRGRSRFQSGSWPGMLSAGFMETAVCSRWVRRASVRRCAVAACRTAV